MRLFVIVFFLLTSCGMGIEDWVPGGGLRDNDYELVVVRDLDRWEHAPENVIEWTDFADHFRIWLDDEPLVGRDEDLGTRLAVHGLLNVLRLADGDETAEGSPLPINTSIGWYLLDSDTLQPFAEILPDEAVWIDAHTRQYRVEIQDEWTRPYAEAAVERIAEAIGRDDLFHVER